MESEAVVEVLGLCRQLESAALRLVQENVALRARYVHQRTQEGDGGAGKGGEREKEKRDETEHTDARRRTFYVCLRHVSL